MAKRQRQTTRNFSPRIANRKAHHKYHLVERVEAGLALVGSEAKSVRNGNVSLDEAFARIVDGEVFLVGCHIAPYEQSHVENHDPLRPRKLLLHKREIQRLETQVAQKGYTLVPLAIYFKRGYAKVEIAVARGKSQVDRRQDIRKREHDREMARAVGSRS